MRKKMLGLLAAAALPWGHKCLRRGQFCKRRYKERSADKYYHRYGFHCYSSGRLT